MIEPGKLGMKESYLARYCMSGIEEKYPVALAYVLTLRKNTKKARELSDNAHRQAFEEYFWDAQEADVLALYKEHGFAQSESEEEAEEAKKD